MVETTLSTLAIPTGALAPLSPAGNAFPSGFHQHSDPHTQQQQSDGWKKTNPVVAQLSQFLVQAMEERLRGDFQHFDFVLQALQDKKTGGNATVATTTSTTTTTTSTNHVKKRTRWLLALTQVVSHLGRKEFAPLVHAVLAMELHDAVAQDVAFCRAYTNLLENLVSAHAFYTPAVCQKIVDRLRFGSGNNGGSGDGNRFHARLHQTLGNILAIVPSGVSTLIPILAAHFPHKRESVLVHEQYVQHLVQIMEYAPTTREPILEFMMEHALQIDVEVTVDMDDLEEDDEQLLAALDYSTAAENSDGSDEEPLDGQQGPAAEDADEYDDDSEEEADAPTEDRLHALKRMKEMMQKLDCVLSTVFYFCQQQQQQMQQQQSPLVDPLSAPASLQSLYMTALTVFDRCILRTHKAKYTQCVLFYLCSLHPSLPDTLLGLLLTRTFDTSLATYLRCTSSAYLASYLARAKYIPAATIAHCLKLCTEWIHSTLDRIERRCRGPNPHKYPVFYSVVQSVLYIFCFRWRELIGLEKSCAMGSGYAEHGENDEDHDHAKETVDGSGSGGGTSGPWMEWWRVRGGFERILYSRLNPLKVCARSVIREFDQISQELQLVYCSSMLFANKMASHIPIDDPLAFSQYHQTRPNISTAMTLSLTASETQSTTEVGGSAHMRSGKTVDVPLEDIIESFFPFDPFYTQLSFQNAIAPLYNSWRSIVEEDEEEDGGDGGSDEEQRQMEDVDGQESEECAWAR